MLQDGQMDPKERFGARASDYARYRPSYPSAVIETLVRECGLDSEKTVADLGSGTGLFARLLLETGATVFGIEPSTEMREEAEMALDGQHKFNSVAGTAEEIPLGDETVDLVTAAQAFHWFEIGKTRSEMMRILRKPGWVALVWNIRHPDSTEFHKDYELLLTKWGIGYKGPTHGQDDLSLIEQVFEGGRFEHTTVHNPQFLFWEELQGRAQSASYFPLKDHENYGPAIDELARIFERHKTGGRVNFDYTTELFLGTLAS